jgi:hypothetical protein
MDYEREDSGCDPFVMLQIVVRRLCAGCARVVRGVCKCPWCSSVWRPGATFFAEPFPADLVDSAPTLRADAARARANPQG